MTDLPDYNPADEADAKQQRVREDCLALILFSSGTVAVGVLAIFAVRWLIGFAGWLWS